MINVGIGFATGRKNFRKVLKTYIYNWHEAGLIENENIRLNLFVAYDLEYSKTQVSDYTQVRPDLLSKLDGVHFIGKKSIQSDIKALAEANIIDEKQAQTLFGRGYAAMRNIILYTALKNKMDYLIFLDDDEYPLAVTKTRATAIWSGQFVIPSHLKYIQQADLTNGHHCGYISPIPTITFNDILSEADFRIFIEAISNDIVNWDTIRATMQNGGVTYADPKVLVSEEVEEVQETNGAKFISGANLCINLTNPRRIFPFYNPPGARGEDTFLSTCLSKRKVLRIPTYAFHDGFSTYQHLLDGVLPIQLNPIQGNVEANIARFYQACLGWIRYKPLLLYITQRDNYESKIKEMRGQLTDTLPKICAYFRCDDFMKISSELDSYHKNVRKHYREFQQNQQTWFNIVSYRFEVN